MELIKEERIFAGLLALFFGIPNSIASAIVFDFVRRKLAIEARERDDERGRKDGELRWN